MGNTREDELPCFNSGLLLCSDGCELSTRAKSLSLPQLVWKGVGWGLAELSACPTDPSWGLGSMCSEPGTAWAGRGLLQWPCGKESRQVPGSQGTHLCSQFVIPEQNPRDKREHQVYWSCLALKFSREMSWWQNILSSSMKTPSPKGGSP